jgi:hypothetical protein
MSLECVYSTNCCTNFAESEYAMSKEMPLLNSAENTKR